MTRFVPIGVRERAAYVREILQYVLPHLRRQRTRMVLGTALAFGAAGSGLAAALLMASTLEILHSGVDASRTVAFDWEKLLDLNTTGQQVNALIWSTIGIARDTQAALLIMGAFLLLATILAVLCNIGSRWMWVSVRTAVQTEMQADLLAHLLELPMSFHVRNRTGAALSRLRDVSDVAQIIPLLFHTFMRAPFLVAGSLLLMVRTSVVLTAITAVAAAGYLVVNFGLGHVVRSSLMRQSVSRADLLSIAQEALLSIRVVKSFGAERAEVAEMRAILDDLIHEEIRSDLLGAHVPNALSQVLSVGAGVAVAIAGLSLVAVGQLSEQGMVMFVITAVAMLASSGVIAQSIIWTYILSASTSRVLELWHARSDLQDGPRRAERFDRTLALRGVSFSYGEGDVLHDVWLEIRRGEVIGIVGPTGSGKSTLADLLLRLYDPQHGRVGLDGVDVREFTQDSYRRLFGVVSQETLLFHDTVRRNIAYGRTGVSDEEIIAAAEAANAHEFILELPAGYDTVVGERGTRLSGGQRQRIAIARAILTRPPILVLDEATSALDNESERQVQEAIDRVIRDCTAVVIAHRISTVQDADRIVVLAQGRIVDVGTHAELMRRGGLYRQLYEAGLREPQPALAVVESAG